MAGVIASGMGGGGVGGNKYGFRMRVSTFGSGCRKGIGRNQQGGAFGVWDLGCRVKGAGFMSRVCIP